VSSAEDALEPFRSRYRFDDWRDARPEESIFVWRFFLGGQELPGHRPLRIDETAAAGWPPATDSLWAGEAGPVRVDVYETSSRVEAGEHLLRLLAEFQSPLLERTDGPGDVAFGMPNGSSIVFLRANAVVVVRNAGDEIEPVEPVARELDRLLAAPLDRDRSPVRPELRRVDVGEGKPARGAPVELLLEADDPLGRRVWFRLSARGGEFSSREGRVYYTPEDEGRQAIEVAALNENLGVASQTLEFDV
jgi:hypothetical protein